MNVLKINLKDPASLMRRNTLIILNILNTEVAVPILLNIYVCSNTIPITERSNTPKSKLLKVSRKNVFPSAIIFKKTSVKKTDKKPILP
jgi:hypothetical protein